MTHCNRKTWRKKSIPIKLNSYVSFFEKFKFKTSFEARFEPELNLSVSQLIIKLKCINKKMILVKESYTSKCDALALESIGYHETYLGNRKKRGLFESSTQKLINADLNGAINIMRKYVNLNYINQTNVCNPTVIKIYDTKL